MLLNLLAMLLCLWSMKNAVADEEFGWATVLGFFAGLNALAIIF